MEVYVARQPIFTKKKKIYGYELLFRGGMTNAFPDIDGDTATSKLLSNSFFNMGIENISAGKKAFINFPQELLVRKVPAMFPREKITVEVLEDVEPNEEVVNACQEIFEKGYQIALDDFFYKSDLKPLIALSKIIKLDFRASSIEEIEQCVEKLTAYPVKFLAEKVETHEEFNKALEMGFDYFQGYFFSKPEILKAKDISPSKINLLQIMAEANKEDFDFEEIQKILARDVSISYKLLRYMNSAYFKRLEEISSIKQAIVLLGEKGLRHFLSLIIMAKLASDKPEELVRTSIIRARLCELLGKLSRHGTNDSELFTIGLFSLIDAILDDTMENLMEKLPFSETIKETLVEGKGVLTNYLELARSYEVGDWTLVSEMAAKIQVREEALPELYVDAVGWADSYSKL